MVDPTLFWIVVGGILCSMEIIFPTAFVRRLFTPKRRVSITGDDLEARAISGIPAGDIGRVLYEGNSWRAKCADEERDIAPNEAVHVVSREGNMLIVLPSKMLDQA